MKNYYLRELTIFFLIGLYDEEFIYLKKVERFWNEILFGRFWDEEVLFIGICNEESLFENIVLKVMKYSALILIFE